MVKGVGGVTPPRRQQRQQRVRVELTLLEAQRREHEGKHGATLRLQRL